MSASPEICFAAIGNAEDPATWSGTPYHFLQAARREGWPIHGLKFNRARAYSLPRRARWAARRWLTFRRAGGFQYSATFLNALWRSVPTPPPGSLLINCSQLFPRRIARGNFRLAFNLDQTLGQLFDYYGHGVHVPPDMRRAAIAEERRQYGLAEAIVLQSQWAANDVLANYGAHPARVHVVIPGANLDSLALDAWDAMHFAPRLQRSGPLKLGFLGKDWQRKGLDRLIRALQLARVQGAEVELHVAGLDPAILPEELRLAEGVRWLGFVDKRRDPAAFLALIDGFDIGCLLSRSEAGGISLLEFARLGLPTLAPDTGGSPEYTIAGATTLIAPDADDARVAEAIHALATDAELYRRQRETAWKGRLWADWRRAAREMREIFDQAPGAPS